MNLCKVCHTELNEDYICPYCGYDGAILTLDSDNSISYKNTLIEKIDNISIKALKYGYSETENCMKNEGSVSIFENGLNGKKCYQSTALSKEWIAHFDEKTELTVNYTFEGKTKILQASVQPKECEGIWYLTLHINEELKLEIGLCVESVDGTTEISRQVLSTVPLDLCA